MMAAMRGITRPGPDPPQLTPALGPQKLPEGLHWHPVQSLLVGDEATRTLDKDPGQEGMCPQSRGQGRQTETLPRPPRPVPAREAPGQGLQGAGRPARVVVGTGVNPRSLNLADQEGRDAPSSSCFGGSRCWTEEEAGEGESELRIPPGCCLSVHLSRSLDGQGLGGPTCGPVGST